MRWPIKTILLSMVPLLGLAVCLANRQPIPSRIAERRTEFRRPTTIPFPASNPYSEAKYALGKKLFFDQRLSGSGRTACASCHNPTMSWTDGLPKAIGRDGRPLARRTPTLWNVAFQSDFFWDGRASSLEDQALMPLQSSGEMDMPLPRLVNKLGSLPEYSPLFRAAFPGQAITAENFAKAIATFERTIVSGVAPFDSWVAGDENAIPDSAKRGFAVFLKAGCVKCHTGWNFTNGVYADTGTGASDLGRGPIIHNANLDHAFKTPTLRDITERGPFFHDGSATTLDAVIDSYDQGGKVKRTTSGWFLKPLHLTQGEKKDLVAFLKTLNGDEQTSSIGNRERGTSWKSLLSFWR